MVAILPASIWSPCRRAKARAGAPPCLRSPAGCASTTAHLALPRRSAARIVHPVEVGEQHQQIALAMVATRAAIRSLSLAISLWRPWSFSLITCTLRHSSSLRGGARIEVAAPFLGSRASRNLPRRMHGGRAPRPVRASAIWPTAAASCEPHLSARAAFEHRAPSGLAPGRTTRISACPSVVPQYPRSDASHVSLTRGRPRIAAGYPHLDDERRKSASGDSGRHGNDDPGRRYPLRESFKSIAPHPRPWRSLMSVKS